MDHSPEGHGVGDLPVEPNIFIGREQPGELGADDTNDVSQHWDEDKTAIECKDKTSTTRKPDGVFEGIKTS